MVLVPAQGEYGDFARRLLDEGLTWGPWIEDQPRVHAAPLVIGEGLRDRLYGVAGEVGRLYEALVEVVWAEPGLLDSFFGLTPWQKKMWWASGGAWHVQARLDAFVCLDGTIKVCEINADTPSGHDDAVGLSALLGRDYGGLEDPNAGLLGRLWGALGRYHESRTGQRGGPRRVGLIYPTEMPEDLALVRLYARWLGSMGVEVVLGSPYNITASSGRVRVMGQAVDLVLRHYKTDWWGERETVWLDEPPYDDPDPLEGPLEVLLAGEGAGVVSVVNPFGSILPQDKLSMAFFWEEMGRFEAPMQAIIRADIPETRRAEVVGTERLLEERAQWVLKSDFGCEGDEVVVGALVEEDFWETCVGQMRPGVWVAQRFFDVAPLEPGGWLPNIGVYLVAGAPAGLYARLTPGGAITTADTRVAPVLVGRL